LCLRTKRSVYKVTFKGKVFKVALLATAGVDKTARLWRLDRG
jgi:hypothetical protein